MLVARGSWLARSYLVRSLYIMEGLKQEAIKASHAEVERIPQFLQGLRQEMDAIEPLGKAILSADAPLDDNAELVAAGKRARDMLCEASSIMGAARRWISLHIPEIESG